MSILEALIILILSFWILVSIFYVLYNKKMARYTNRFDLFRWISAYQLFSDTPRVFRLFYRDKLPDNEPGDWQNIPLVPSFRWYHFIWFPDALVMKTIQSTVDDLTRLVESGQNRIEKVSERFIYQTVLRFTYRVSPPEKLVQRQFKIEETIRTVDNFTIREVFISGFHNQ